MSQNDSKQELRVVAGQRRNAEKDRMASSESIAGKVIAMPRVASASVICCYVSFRSEVDTHHLIQKFLESNKTVVVPWCDGDDLRLTRIVSMGELKPRTLGLLEPDATVRENVSRNVRPENVDVFLVPGLAFTQSGDRLGYGRGYYDRMLALSPHSWKIGIAFDIQVVETIHVNRLDIPMNSVVTGTRVFS